MRQIRFVAMVPLALVLAGCGAGGSCGLGLHDRVTEKSTAGAPNTEVPCCGAALSFDVELAGQGDAQFDLSNVSAVSAPNLVDAFLTSTSCAHLFNGPYPGSAPMCDLLVGPAAPGKVTGTVGLPAGTYRLWVQSYTSNAATAPFFIDVGIWDQSCRSPLN
jgi:hypothetical protein